MWTPEARRKIPSPLDKVQTRLHKVGTIQTEALASAHLLNQYLLDFRMKRVPCKMSGKMGWDDDSDEEDDGP